MVARYFDSVWPEYQRTVVDGSGVVIKSRPRPFSYFTVTNYFLFSYI
jgi:hypothetical protein